MTELLEADAYYSRGGPRSISVQIPLFVPVGQRLG
jgi:hypothetical protein